MPAQTKLLLILIVITVLSGFGDAQGFVHAARIWQEGKLVWAELAKSALGFGCGIVLYWLAIRFLVGFGVISAETQTLLWFGATMIGVALLSGRFFRWQPVDQTTALMVLLGIGWLLYHTGE